MKKDLLQVKIISPEKTLFEGEADAVSSINNIGKFDILPHHANFISLIQDQITVHTRIRETKTFKIKKAVIHVRENTVRAFVGLASP